MNNNSVSVMPLSAVAHTADHFFQAQWALKIKRRCPDHVKLTLQKPHLPPQIYRHFEDKIETCSLQDVLNLRIPGRPVSQQYHHHQHSMSEWLNSLRKQPPETPSTISWPKQAGSPKSAAAIPIYPSVPSYLFKKDKQTHFDELKKKQISYTSTESPTKLQAFEAIL